MLRTEAGIASFEQRYAEEECLVEQALAVCDEHDLGIARAYTEASVVGARARAGNVRAARALARTWPRRRREARGPLEAFRDVAELELAVLEGRHGAARAAGARVLPFWESRRHAVMTCFVQLRLVLSSTPAHATHELAEFRRVVRRCPIPYYTRRLALLDELVGNGGCAADVRLQERSRHGVRELPLSSAWTPPVTALGADLFWNEVSQTIHLRGRGPFCLDAHPVLRRVLGELTHHGHSPIPTLFREVWGGEYHPISHEGKIHVTLHRLRNWLRSRDPDSADLIEVSDGTVRLRRTADFRVLYVHQADRRRSPQGGAQSVRARVLECIRAGDETVAPRHLERRLGVSRPALNTALRALVADGHLERLGRGRATQYRPLGP